MIWGHIKAHGFTYHPGEKNTSTVAWWKIRWSVGVLRDIGRSIKNNLNQN